MLLKVDAKTWIEIPNDSTEEFKKAKIEKYNKEKEEKLNRLKAHGYNYKKTYKQNSIGVLYDKRVNLTSILKSLY
jgi:hypothetical protein